MSVVDDLIEEFEDLDETEAYQTLDELGRTLPKLDDSAYVKQNIVPGCQSRVWMIKQWSDTTPATIKIHADSDAIVVKGLVYVLIQIYDGKTAQEILDEDYLAIFEQLSLSRLITPQRKNGLFAMVKSIRDFASQAMGSVADASPGNAIAKSTATITRKIESIAAEFPILQRPLPSGLRPVFLDSGASAQKPAVVIEKEREVEEQYYANAFRGRYYFGQRIDDEIEATRVAAAQLIGAERSDEVVFNAGTTASINLVAAGWGRKHLQPGDEVVITEMEHHANFVPWQVIAEERGAKLRILSINHAGELDPSEIASVINDRTAIVAVCSMSNVLGTINPIEAICRRAHECGAVVMVDAAQSVPHQRIDVVRMGIDFLAFSGHKLYGPSGVGVLYGRYDLLREMSPVQFGGHMIQTVGRESSTWSDPPAKFEAGTMPIVQIIGLGAAIEFVNSIGLDAIARHEHKLLVATHQQLAEIPGLKIYGPEPDKKGAIVSFSIDGISPEDLAIRLDQRGVFTRHGNHCAMVLHEKLGVPATTRASFGVYNTLDDVDVLATAIRDAVADISR